MKRLLTGGIDSANKRIRKTSGNTIFDPSYITRHFINFQNNAEPTYRNKYGPLLVVRTWDTPKTILPKGDTRHNRITKDALESIHLETVFPWERDLEKRIDFSRIKSLKLIIYNNANPSHECDDPRDDTNARDECDNVGACSNVIQRMKSLEYLSICQYAKSKNPEMVHLFANSHLLGNLLTGLSRAEIDLKRLKLKRMRLKGRDLAILSSYLTKSSTLEELELDAYFDPVTKPRNVEILRTFFGIFIDPNSFKTLILKKLTFLTDVNVDFGQLPDVEQGSEPGQPLDDNQPPEKYNNKEHPKNFFVSEPEKILCELMYEFKGHHTSRDTRGPVSIWDFQSTIDTPSALYTVLCPQQITWLHANGYINGRFTVRDLMRCNKVCNSTHIELGGSLSGIQKKELMDALDATSIESLILREPNMSFSDIVTLLKNATLKNLYLCDNVPFIDAQSFLQLAPYIASNTKLTFLNFGDNDICFYERNEVAALCEIIEKNSTLNCLTLRGEYDGSPVSKDDEKYELFLGDIIRSAKKNCSLWQCDVNICESKSFFFEPASRDFFV